MQHLRITQASAVSAFVFIVGQLVAFVPAFGPDKQALIAAGTAVIAAVFLIANAIHALASSKVTVSDVESAAEQAAKTAVSKIDLNALAKDALAGNLSVSVRSELQKILGTTLGAPAAAAPATTTGGPVDRGPAVA